MPDPISLFEPPIIPANPTGRSESAMTNIPVFNFRDNPSKVSRCSLS